MDEATLRGDLARIYDELMGAVNDWNFAALTLSRNLDQTVEQALAMHCFHIRKIAVRSARFFQGEKKICSRAELSSVETSAIEERIVAIDELARRRGECEATLIQSTRDDGKLEAALKAYKQSDDLLRAGMSDLFYGMQSPGWNRAEAFDAALMEPTWGCSTLGLFGALPDFGWVVPTVRCGYPKSSLKTGDKITGIRSLGATKFVSVQNWNDIKLFCLAFAPKTNDFEIRVSRGGVEYIVPVPGDLRRRPERQAMP